MFTSGIETVISDDGTTIKITYYPKEDEEYAQIWFPVWSTENDQEDKIVYPAELCEDGSWIAIIDRTRHTQIGELNIHVYGGETDATDMLSKVVANVKKKVGQCLKKIRPPALEKTRPLGLKTLEIKYTTW